MPLSQHNDPKSDIQIAREAAIQPIKDIAAQLVLGSVTCCLTVTTRPRSLWSTSTL